MRQCTVNPVHRVWSCTTLGMTLTHDGQIPLSSTVVLSVLRHSITPPSGRCICPFLCIYVQDCCEVVLSLFPHAVGTLFVLSPVWVLCVVCHCVVCAVCRPYYACPVIQDASMSV